jgi:hypothetical protein
METHGFNQVDPTVQIIFMAVGAIIGIGIQALICYFVYNFFKAIPDTFHEMPPGQVWLLLIPCFGYVWVFFVFPKLARSYQRLFEYYGVHDVGDCGYSQAMTYAVLYALTPLTCGCTWPVALVFLILFLVKMNELKGHAQRVVYEAYEAHQAGQGQG